MSASDYFKKALLQGQQTGADTLNGFAQGQEQFANQKALRQQDNDASLRQLITGKEFDEGAKTRAHAQELTTLHQLLGKYPKTAVKSGEFSVNPESAASLKPVLTPAQEAAERAAGKQLTDFEAGGGRPGTTKALESLGDVKNDLMNDKRDGYDRVVGGALSGWPTLMGMFAPSEKGRRDKVRNTALGIVKQSDPNPTEKQQENTFGQMYDSSSSNEANLDRITRFEKEQQETSAQKEAAAANYHKTGYATMSPGGGPPPSMTRPPAAPPKAPAETPEQEYARLRAKHKPGAR